MRKRETQYTLAQIEEHVIHALSQFQPMSHRQYAELFGLDKATANKRFKLLWRKNIIYVDSRQRQTRSGPACPLYCIGSMNDAPYLEPLTHSQKSERHKINLKTKNGGKGWKRRIKKAIQRKKQRMETDPVFAYKVRKANRDHYERKYGLKTGKRRVNDSPGAAVAKADPVLAALMGVGNP